MFTKLIRLCLPDIFFFTYANEGSMGSNAEFERIRQELGFNAINGIKIKPILFRVKYLTFNLRLNDLEGSSFLSNAIYYIVIELVSRLAANIIIIKQVRLY